MMVMEQIFVGIDKQKRKNNITEAAGQPDGQEQKNETAGDFEERNPATDCHKHMEGWRPGA